MSKILGEIAGMKSDIVVLLSQLPEQNRRQAPGGGTIYVLESFECEIDHSGNLHYAGKGNTSFAVQVSDQSRLGDDVFLAVYEGRHRIMVEGYRGRSLVPRIEEYFSGKRYPHFEIKWGDGPANSGELVFVRVDLSGTEFVNIENYSGNGFKSYRNGRYDMDPTDGQPRSVEGVERLLGQTIARQIDCEERAGELLAQCGLADLLREVREALSPGSEKI